VKCAWRKKSTFAAILIYMYEVSSSDDGAGRSFFGRPRVCWADGLGALNLVFVFYIVIIFGFLSSPPVCQSSGRGRCVNKLNCQLVAHFFNFPTCHLESLMETHTFLIINLLIKDNE
jgi:hypothetical protein